MNIYQMQALDFVLKKTVYQHRTTFSYKVIFRMNGELFSGEFMETDETGAILESPMVTAQGTIQQFPFNYDYTEESPIKRLNLIIFPNQISLTPNKYQTLLSEGKSLHLIHETLAKLISQTSGKNELAPVIYNIESLTYGYKLPYLQVEEETEFVWISLDKNNL